MTLPNIPVQRPQGETTSVQVPLSMTPTEHRMLERLRGMTPRATFIKHLLELADKGELSTGRAATQTTRVPVLTVAPCGDFREAIADTSSALTISVETAKALHYGDDDIFVIASGESMQGAGIIDGQHVLMTPLEPYQRPRRDDIVLVQIIRDGEIYEATIKKWMGEEGNKPILHDGNDKPVKLPDRTERVIPVAIAKSVIGRI